MNNGEVDALITEIVVDLKDSGYDPYEQLTEYVKTGSSAYIIRRDNARTKTELLGRDYIRSRMRMIKEITSSLTV